MKAAFNSSRGSEICFSGGTLVFETKILQVEFQASARTRK